MKNTKDYINSFSFLILGVILPTKLVIGETLRILFLGRNLFLKKKAFWGLLICFIFLVIKFILFKQLEFAQFGILASILSYTTIKKGSYNVNFSGIDVTLLCLLNLFFVIFNSDIFYVDPNYSSFVFLLLSLILWQQRHFLASLLILSTTLFLYSRLFIVASFIFLIFKLPSFKSKIEIKFPFFTTIFVYLTYFILSGFILFNHLNSEIPEYVYLEGFNRISRLIDTSNWIRFSANFRMLNSLDFNTLVFGFNNPISFPEYPNKTIYPHNLFLGLMYNLGIFWTLAYTFYLIKESSKHREIFWIICIYQIILGFGSFYIYILPLLVLINNSYEKNLTHRR